VDRNGPIRAALRTRLAQPEQESLKETWHEKADRLKKCVDYATSGHEQFMFRQQLSAHLVAPQPQRQPLTEMEIEGTFMVSDDKCHEFARAIERLHGITGEDK
jgi:hypothetical protein